MGKLGDALLREFQEDSQKEVEQFVGEDVDRPFGGAFARACAESKADLAARQLHKARAQLKDKPGCIETAGGQQAFRRPFLRFPAISSVRFFESTESSERSESRKQHNQERDSTSKVGADRHTEEAF